jgi:hypothetical protein
MKNLVEYAKTSWCPEDVQTLKPAWTLEQCEEVLFQFEGHIIDRMVESGWDAMEYLMNDLDSECIKEPSNEKLEHFKRGGRD